MQTVKELGEGSMWGCVDDGSVRGVDWVNGLAEGDGRRKDNISNLFERVC